MNQGEFNKTAGTARPHTPEPRRAETLARRSAAAIQSPGLVRAGRRFRPSAFSLRLTSELCRLAAVVCCVFCSALSLPSQAQNHPVIQVSATALIAESCSPTNGVIDPGETVTVLITLTNAGSGSTTQLVATLLQDSGVASPSGPQSYGALAAGGPAVSQPYTFTAEGFCGGSFTATLQLQDGATNLGTAAASLAFGGATTSISQNFDSVTVPALPPGWTSSVTNFQTVGQLQVPWITTNSNADTPPNAAYVPDATSPAFSDLVSPAATLPANPMPLTFRSSYNIELDSGTSAYDGGVLEIKIGSSGFTDILAAGGSFASNGYNCTIITTSGNQLGGRQAWSGNSHGYVTTVVNLPAAAAGQLVQFRWRLSTDINNSYSVTGWYVDTINIPGLSCCSQEGPILPAQSDVTIDAMTALAVTNAAYDPQNSGAAFTYTLANPPAGAAINSSGVINWTPSLQQGPGTYAITTIVTEIGSGLSATNGFYVTVNQILVPPYPTNATPVAVLTQHNNLARTGANLGETLLNIVNVNTNQFGLLFTRAVDDQIYAQPLLMTNVAIPGQGAHNVVIVATVNDSVYAFEADDPAVTAPYWHVNFLGTNAVPPAYSDAGGCVTFSGNIGIVGTPVIDPVAGTIYVVARTKENGTQFVQRLHALDITTGAERSNSPVVITATYPGTNGVDSTNGVITFNPLTQNQRPALALVNGLVYIGWSSQCDQQPYHGWLMGYDAVTLQQVVVYMDTPNGQQGGIWMSGEAPAADANGNLYLSLGNGPPNNTVSPQNPANRVESILKMSLSNSTLNVASSFTPYNWQTLDETDDDLGSSGVLLIPGTSLAFTGSKQGKAYLVNRDNMGGLSTINADTNVVQSFQVTATTGFDNIHGAPVWWDGPNGSYAYIQGEADYLRQYEFNWTNEDFLLPNFAQSPTTAPTDGMPGGFLAVSAFGTNAGTGIVWASHQYSGDAENSTRPGILHAYNAENVSHELWNSQQDSARDSVGNFAKFVPPMVANGKVYLATFSNRLNVYGLAPPESLNLTHSGKNISLSWATNALLTFSLQTSSNLLTGNWVAVTNTPVPTNGFLQVTLPVGAHPAFYRLKH
jgi:hypothetical protein